MNWFEKWCSDNSKWGKLSRTIVQGIIGILVANIDLLIGSFSFGISEPVRGVIVMIIMAILSPIQASIGEKIKEVQTDDKNS